MTKRLIALLLAGAMLLPLAACTPASTPAHETEPTATNPPVTDTPETSLLEQLAAIVWPADGVFLARLDDLSEKKHVSGTPNELMTIMRGVAFKHGQADMRPDMLIVVDKTYYLYRSKTGQINDPVGNRNGTVSDEWRKKINGYYETYGFQLGFDDELVQFTGPDPIQELKEYVLEHGTPCTVYCTSSGYSGMLITYDPHCLQCGKNAPILSVDAMSGWLTVYFTEDERIVFEENGERMRFSRKNSFTHVLNRDEPFDRSTVQVFGGISGTISYSTAEAINLEIRRCDRLDKAFKEDWGLNLSLERLGFWIGDKKPTQPDEPSPLPDGAQLFTFSADVNSDGVPDNVDLIINEGSASLRFRNGLSGTEMPHKIPQLGGDYHGTYFLSTNKKTGASKLMLWLWWFPDPKTFGVTLREFCFSNLKKDEQIETQLVWKQCSLLSSARYDTYATHDLFPYICDLPSDGEHSLYLLYDNSGGAVRQSTPDQLIEVDTALITEILTRKMADYLAVLAAVGSVNPAAARTMSLRDVCCNRTLGKAQTHSSPYRK